MIGVKGMCPSCRRFVRVLNNGQVGPHNDPADTSFPPVRCAGWRKTPEQMATEAAEQVQAGRHLIRVLRMYAPREWLHDQPASVVRAFRAASAAYGYEAAR